MVKDVNKRYDLGNIIKKSILSNDNLDMSYKAVLQNQVRIYNELEEVNLEIMDLEFKIKLFESNEVLEFDFKEVYGEDNESIRKSHLFRENRDYYERLDELKYMKNCLEDANKIISCYLEYLKLKRED